MASGCCKGQTTFCGACKSKLKRVYHRGRVVIVCSNPRCVYSRPR